MEISELKAKEEKMLATHRERFICGEMTDTQYHTAVETVKFMIARKIEEISRQIRPVSA